MQNRAKFQKSSKITRKILEYLTESKNRNEVAKIIITRELLPFENEQIKIKQSIEYALENKCNKTSNGFRVISNTKNEGYL